VGAEVNTATDKDAGDDESVRAIQRYLDASAAACAVAIVKIFGTLPRWMPEPALPLIRQAIANLRADGQPNDRIVELVSLARNCELEVVPGIVRDVTAFFQSVHYLAHVQWALSLEKARAIEELGGREAAKNYKRSRAGNLARLQTTEGDRRARNNELRQKAAAMKNSNSRLGVNAVATQLSQSEQLSVSTIKRILRSSD
jgi:hypothetical protein